MWLQCVLAVGVAVSVISSRRCAAQTGDDVIGQLCFVFVHWRPLRPKHTGQHRLLTLTADTIGPSVSARHDGPSRVSVFTVIVAGFSLPVHPSVRLPVMIVYCG